MVEIGTIRTRKPFYKNLDDTLEDARITKRQLGYWRKEGLFVPELGPRSKFYTLRDIQFLVLLRRLIQDLGLPVATVQRLIAVEGERRLQPDERLLLDIRDGRLLSPRDAISHLMIHALAGSDLDEIRRWFRMLALALLSQAAESAPTAGVYAATKQDLHQQLDHVDLAARVTRAADGRPTLDPALPEDPEVDASGVEKAEGWFDEQAKLSVPLVRARARKNIEEWGSGWVDEPESHIFEPQPSMPRGP